MPTPLAIRSVLAATDLSPSSREALRAAAALSAHAGAELHVLYALDASRTPGGEDVLEMQRRIHDARALLRAEVREAIPEAAQTTTQHVAIGRAPEAIRQRAEVVHADVVVVGPHRNRGFGDQMLGTTADQVIRECPVPCLVARGPLRVPLRRVLVPSDLSEVARGALGAAVRWTAALRPSGAPAPEPELTVIHVESDSAASADGTVPRFQRWSQLGEHVSAARHLVAPDAAPRVQREIIYGTSPADEILEFAREYGADLVVMGTRGDRPLMKALLGSVSAAVARATGTPLLLIPPSVWSAPDEEAEVLDFAEAVDAPPPA